MARANFQAKSQLAAAALLPGFERDAFLSVLDETLVGIHFDDAAVESREGRALLDLSIRLLARIHPDLLLRPSGRAAEQYVDGLIGTAREINPDIGILDQGAARALLVVGSKTPIDEVRRFFVGSDGWLAKFSTTTSRSLGGSGNPIGAGAAACIGVANMFRAVFSRFIPNCAQDEDLELSLFDYRRGGSNPPVTGTLGHFFLAGAGAIGNGLIWTLAQSDLAGTLDIVDGEAVDLTNLQRYVLTLQVHAANKVAKSELAEIALKVSRIRARGHRARWGEFLATGERDIALVAVALDSVTDRIALQASLPREVINAWTQPGNVGVSRHFAFGKRACVACLYWPKEATKSEDILVAEAIGLGKEFRRIREMLHYRAPVDRELLTMIATANSIPFDRLLPFEGKQVREFYVEAVCGGVLLDACSGALKLEVPAPFQSALAGIALAGEVIARRVLGRDATFPTVTVMDLMRPVGSELSYTQARVARCICADSTFQNVYRERHHDALGD